MLLKLLWLLYRPVIYKSMSHHKNRQINYIVSGKNVLISELQFRSMRK